MALIKFDAKKRESNKRKVVEEGTYIGRIAKIKQDIDKKGDPYVLITFKGDRFEEYSLYLGDNDISKGSLYDIYVAIGLDPEENHDEKELLGKYIQFDIVHRGERKDGTPYENMWNIQMVVNDTDGEEDDEEW